MPELPEVEAARRSVQEHMVGKKILTALAEEDDKVIENVAPAELEKALNGRVVVAAKRKGKILWLQLDQAPHPAFHFGMTGSIQMRGVKTTQYKRAIVSEEDEWPPKYHKLRLQMEGGLEVAFTDPRRFARIRLHDDPEGEKPIMELGPDALLELPGIDAFTAALCERKLTLKGLLLDQGFLSGIGNWVADEILYKAKLHPEQPASSLSNADCALLHDSIQKVLETAVEANADSEKFPEDWMFHVRWGKKAGSLNGETIAFIKVGGRTSAYVPAVQKLVGPTKQGKAAGRGSRKRRGAEVEEDEVVEPAAKKVKRGKGRTPPGGDAEGETAVPAGNEQPKGRRKPTRAKPSGREQEPPEESPGGPVSRSKRGVAKSRGKAGADGKAATATEEAEAVVESLQSSGMRETKGRKKKGVKVEVGGEVATASLDGRAETESKTKRKGGTKKPSAPAGKSSTRKVSTAEAGELEEDGQGSNRAKSRRQRTSAGGKVEQEKKAARNKSRNRKR